ncbi:MAG: hypothetical protein ACTSUO_08420 [Candidatus Thorarchaeota archaeon]
MRLVEFDAINSEGGKTKVLVNPDQVCVVATAVVPGKMAGPDGKPIGKVAAILDFGVKVMPVDNTVEEVKVKLLGEEVK